MQGTEENSAQKTNEGVLTVDDMELKKKRDQYNIEIRKEKRDEFFSQKRMKILGQEKNRAIRTPKTAEEEQMNDLIDLWIRKSFKIEDLPDLVKAINSNDLVQQHYGVIGIRKLLSQPGDPPIQLIIDANIIPKLLDFLKPTKPSYLQLESAWALTNIASGNNYETQAIVDKGGLPSFINLLNSPIQEIVEQAFWLLGNICGDSSFHRDAVLKQGGLEVMIKAVGQCNDDGFIRIGIWTISNMIRGRPLPAYHLVSIALPFMAKMARTVQEDAVLVDIAWSLAYLSDGKNDRRDEVLETGVAPVLKTLLENGHVAIIIPTLRTIGNIISGTIDHLNAILDIPGMPTMILKMLNHDHQSVRREASWVSSNIAAGSSVHIAYIVDDPSIVKLLIEMVQNDGSEIAKEALWTLSNATNKASDLQMLKLWELGVLRCFLEKLSAEDPKVLEIALEGIKNLLNFGQMVSEKSNSENKILTEFESFGGVDKCEFLQRHKSYQVYTTALSILETHYDVEAPI